MKGQGAEPGRARAGKLIHRRLITRAWSAPRLTEKVWDKAAVGRSAVARWSSRSADQAAMVVVRSQSRRKASALIMAMVEISSWTCW